MTPTMPDPPPTEEEILIAMRAAVLAFQLFAASTALFCFDYCLTFRREVQRIWSLGFEASTALFYCVRYSALINTLFVILAQTRWKGVSDQNCSIIVHFQMALNIILLTAAAVFSALRAYALCWKDTRVLVLILGLGMAHPIIALYTFVKSDVFYVVYPYYACGFASTISVDLYENCMIVARTTAVLTDLLVLIITIAKTWPLRAAAAKLSFTSTVSHVMMRNGVLYFGVLLVGNTVGLGTVRSFKIIQPISAWIAILTAVMMSRFIIDLHEAADPYAGVGTFNSSHAHVSTIRFQDSHLGAGTSSSRVQPRGGVGSVFGTTTVPTSDWLEDEYELEDEDNDFAADLAEREGCENVVWEPGHPAKVDV